MYPVLGLVFLFTNITISIYKAIALKTTLYFITGIDYIYVIISPTLHQTYALISAYFSEYSFGLIHSSLKL